MKSKGIYTQEEVIILLTDLASTSMAWDIKNKYSLSERQKFYEAWLKEKGLLNNA